MLAPPLFRPVASKGKPHKAHDLYFSRFPAVEGRERHWETIRARYQRSLPLFCYSSLPVHSLKVGGALAVLFISTTFMVYFLLVALDDPPISTARHLRSWGQKSGGFRIRKARVRMRRERRDWRGESGGWDSSERAKG